MPTTNTDMNAMMRKRRQEMADLPAYEGPPAAADEAETPEEEATEGESPSGMTVAAPGDPSTGDDFEYEPLTDRPGAWAVYPPGVPCDDTAYRVQMDRPATEADFAKMKTAIEDAGGTTESSDTSDTTEEEGAY